MRPTGMRDDGRYFRAEPDDATLDRYLAGEANEQERRQVEAWQTASPVGARLLGELQVPGMLDDAAGMTRPFDYAEVQEAIERRIARVGNSSSRKLSVSRRFPAIRSWLGVGAVAIGAVAAIVSVTFVQTSTSSGEATVEYTTATGERLTVTLPDGSRVTLAPETSLRFYSDAKANERRAELQGRAYFEVAPTDRVPFVVHTGTVNTRVLGTVFDVAHYPDDKRVTVIVTEGKVASGSSTVSPVILTAGMLASLSDSSANVTDVSDAVRYTQWTTGHLAFRGTPVHEVLTTLSRWYGVRFAIADSTLSSQRITTVIDYTNITDLVTVLETILSATATTDTIAGSAVITLHPNVKQSRPAPTRRMIDNELQPALRVGR